MEDTNETKKINNAKSLEEKFAKKSKEINYSTTIFENQPQINFYKVEEERQDGTIENRVAYEVSVGSLEVVEENETTESKETENQEAV